MANSHPTDIGRPLQYETVDHLNEAIEEYFETKAKVNLGEYVAFRPTMAGLAYHLGLSRQGLLNYSKRDEFVDAIKGARIRVEEALEQRLYDNAPTGAIFNLKNNFGWNDRSELDQTVTGHQTHEHKHEHEYGNAVLDALKNKHGE